MLNQDQGIRGRSNSVRKSLEVWKKVCDSPRKPQHFCYLEHWEDR